MGKTIIYIGITLVAVGLVLLLLEKQGWTKLPGDVIIKKEDFTFYFPIMTSILISVILTLLIYFIQKLR